MTEDNFQSYFAHWMVIRYSVVYKSLEKFILECHQHGIFEFIRRKYRKIPKQVETEQKVLTMYMLSAGFYIWLGSALIACIVFIGEHVHKYVSDRKRRERVVIIIIDECQNSDNE